MNNMGFGKLVEKLIYFSGQKNYTLAKYLGYDVSYISKWISGSMLPSSKHIRKLSDNIAEYVIDNLTESTYDEIVKYFSIDSRDEDILIKFLKSKINEEYIYSYEITHKKNNTKNTKVLNSVININPRKRKKTLQEDVINLIKQEEDITNIVIMANTLSLDMESKMNLAGISVKNYLTEIHEKINLKLLISFEDEVKDIVINTVLFINLISSYINKKYEIYSYQIPQSLLVVAIENKLFYNAMYIDNERCLYTSHSTELEVVEESYETLVDIVNTKSKPTFLQKTSEEMIIDKNYIQYIIGNKLKWLIGNMNELFMPSDLFIEIAQEVFGDKEDVIEELKKVDAILQNATYNSDLKVILYETGLRRYISTGNLNFFNKSITLNLDQRQRHIEYMEKLFRENENIGVKFINGDLIDELKDNENPSLYMSKTISFIRVTCTEDENKYLVVKDKRLENIFNNFFEEVWNMGDNKINSDREDVLERVVTTLNYTKILNDNLNEN